MDKQNKKKNLLKFLQYIVALIVVIVCLILTICLKLNWFTFVACIAGIFYLVFLSERNVLNFIIGFFSTGTYIFVAYQARIYGEVIFYLVFDLPFIFISYFLWKKHVTNLKVESRKLSLKASLIIFFISATTVVGYAYLLKAIGGQNVWVDAISTIVSCIATVLMSLRYREQWVMWIIVYVVSVILWATTFDLLMLIMSICCLLSSILGFILWTKSIKKSTNKIM